MATRLVLFLLSVWLAATSVGVHARLEFVGRVPNGNNVGAVHALGHVAWDGSGPLNAFGKAFAAAGNVWTKALCQGDADGDGQTNGEELGDPCCQWRAGDHAAPPFVTDVVSHPGDFGSKLNETDLRSRVCACQAATTKPSLHDDTSSSSSRAQAPLVNSSGSSSRGSADDAILPPGSVVPTPAASSSSSSLRSSAFDRVFGIAVGLIVAMLILVVS